MTAERIWRMMPWIGGVVGGVLGLSYAIRGEIWPPALWLVGVYLVGGFLFGAWWGWRDTRQLSATRGADIGQQRNLAEARARFRTAGWFILAALAVGLVSWIALDDDAAPLVVAAALVSIFALASALGLLRYLERH